MHNITDKDAFIFGFPYGFRWIQEEVRKEQLEGIGEGKGDLRFNEHIDNELKWNALISLLQVSFMLALQVKSTQIYWGHLYPATGLHLLPFCPSTNCTVWPQLLIHRKSPPCKNRLDWTIQNVSFFTRGLRRWELLFLFSLQVHEIKNGEQ